MIPDNQFIRAFSSSASGVYPPRFFSVRKDHLIETTRSPAFFGAYAELMHGAQQGCLASIASACAAFVADTARIGRADWAWRFMLKSSDLGHARKDAPFCWSELGVAANPGPKRSCITTQAQFPGALHWFLSDAGYL